jgi:alanyl-tRNA synthetase
MNPTERLYYGNSLLFDFRAEVLGHSQFEGSPSLILNQTAFYPEGGGQNPDHGTLNAGSVVNVQVDDDGLIHHFVEGSSFSTGDRVEGIINPQRRRLNMALHTGQHMLSRALLDVANAPTVSSRLGEGNCTIDLDVDHLSDADVARAEQLVNDVINDDRNIRSWFPSDEELAQMVLRRTPKVQSGIRVVEVDGFDLTPCGGTHCTNTAQIGLVRIRALERNKGMYRISFAAGSRARNEVLESTLILRDLARSFSCGPDGVTSAVSKVQEHLENSKLALKEQTELLAQALYIQLLADQGKEEIIIAEIPGASRDLLLSIADRIVAEPNRAALMAGLNNDSTAVLLLRGVESSFDCGTFLKTAASLAEGRGGGRPERAEGRLPAGIKWREICQEILSA